MLDIRAINALQRALDDPRTGPADLSEIILSSNLMNMIARQAGAERDEAKERWAKEFGLQEQAGERAQQSLDAQIRQLDENIAALQKRLGFEETRLGFDRERLDITKDSDKLNTALSLLQTGLQYPGTGFATPQVSQRISSMTGIPLPQNYGQGAPSNAWTGNAQPFMNMNATGGTAPFYNQGDPFAGVPLGGRVAGTPGQRSGIPGMRY